MQNLSQKNQKELLWEVNNKKLSNLKSFSSLSIFYLK